MQNRRVHQNDVRHRNERRQTREDLRPPVRPQLLKFEVLFRFAKQDLFTIADADANIEFANRHRALPRTRSHQRNRRCHLPNLSFPRHAAVL